VKEPQRPSIQAIALALLLALAVLTPVPVAAQAQPRDGRAEPPAPRQPPATLPSLYERLKAATSPEEAQGVVRLIVQRWNRSGSDTADLLMTRARAALAKSNPALAVELLDRVTVLQPGWAEAWHARGLAFFVLQDDVRALADFREAIRREPGHFMAVGMTAAALRRQGDERGALRAYRALQTMHPHFQGLKDAIEKLTPEVEGRDA
jgi:tetratricopeptide (TPR) repeat protein